MSESELLKSWLSGINFQRLEAKNCVISVHVTYLTTQKPIQGHLTLHGGLFFHGIVVICLFFIKLTFSKILSGTLAECRTVRFLIRTDKTVSPDLGPNCLQRLSADDKSRR